MHQFAVARAELQDHVFVSLIRFKARSLELRPAHILVKHLDKQNAVRLTKIRFPEAFQIVTTGVVGPGVFDIVRRRFSSHAALVTHRLHNPLPVFHHHDGRAVSRKNAPVSRRQPGSLQVFELAFGPCNLIGGDALTFSRCFGDLCLQGSFCIRQTLALLEELLFASGGLPGVEPAD
ncbi:hypothetical protein QFZ96_002476 [Paraburkholderia youngii]